MLVPSVLLSVEEWSSEQQGCVRSIQEGLEGVVTLLRQFGHDQMCTGRQRTSEVQDSLAQSQSNAQQYQVNTHNHQTCSTLKLLILCYIL